VVPEINCSILSNVDSVATSTSCNKVIKTIVWWSLFVDMMLQFLVLPFKFTNLSRCQEFLSFCWIEFVWMCVSCIGIFSIYIWNNTMSHLNYYNIKTYQWG
jgi:hypothetical protein